MRSINIPPALRYRSFRLLWFGLILSITGTRMQSTAVLWHIHEHNPEPIALGAVGLVTILPVLVLSLVAGAIADAVNRRYLLILTQFTLAPLAALLGWLTLRGADSLAMIYIVIAASAAVSTFDLPARQALVPNLVPRETLTNAFSLNSIAYTTGAILGPTLGGAGYRLFWCRQRLLDQRPILYGRHPRASGNGPHPSSGGGIHAGGRSAARQPQPWC